MGTRTLTNRLGQPHLLRLPLYWEVAVSLIQAFTRFKWNSGDQRRTVRKQVDFPAWIDIGDGSAPLAATVLDISEGGARIVISSATILPKSFWLILNNESKRRRPCCVALRYDTEVCVQYLDTIQYGFAPPILFDDDRIFMHAVLR